ncbi:MAG TPA: hypothetical protein DCP92_11830 [Nitrospiraceae bacterium]|jgi:hypothetical protein|nr:hypothetical protein [Nitrospiraceae bacterium]
MRVDKVKAAVAETIMMTIFQVRIARSISILLDRFNNEDSVTASLLRDDIADVVTVITLSPARQRAKS